MKNFADMSPTTSPFPAQPEKQEATSPQHSTAAAAPSIQVRALEGVWAGLGLGFGLVVGVLLGMRFGSAWILAGLLGGLWLGMLVEALLAHVSRKARNVPYETSDVLNPSAAAEARSASGGTSNSESKASSDDANEKHESNDGIHPSGDDSSP